jgi:hypothetical protein
LPRLVAQCQLIAPNFSLQGPLLPLLVVLNHVLALSGPVLPRLVAQCQLIAPNSSLRDLHAFVLEQQHSFDFLFLLGNEDSLFNSLLWYASQSQLSFDSLSLCGGKMSIIICI